MIPALVIPAAVWIVLSIGLGRGIGRAIKVADDALADNTQPAVYPPPVPPSLPRLAPDPDAQWLAAWPADTPISVIERAYYDKEFLAIPEVAQDLAVGVVSLNQHHAPRRRMSELTQAWLCAALPSSILCMEAIDDGEIVSAILYGSTVVLTLTSAALAQRLARIEHDAHEVSR